MLLLPFTLFVHLPRTPAFEVFLKVVSVKAPACARCRGRRPRSKTNKCAQIVQGMLGAPLALEPEATENQMLNVFSYKNIDIYISCRL